MSYTDQIKALASRLPALEGVLETEEATKNALVMPFIAALGYNVFDPTEVVPEFTADVGLKRGEKVDYAIKHGNEVVILVEAKRAGDELKLEHSSQLYRYFSVVRARIACLTNGVVYRFYTDLDEPNKMDRAPFLEIDLSDLRDNLLVQLRKLTKDGFDLDHMLSAATDLKYTAAIRRVIEAQLEDPDEEFVRFFFSHSNPNGRFVQSAREQFAPLVKQAFSQVISDRVGSRLRSALQHEDVASGRAADGDPDAPPAEGDDGIDTTEEELEGFRIVRAIACRELEPARVVHRDTKSYFGILVDDNNRKPLCRLRFNTSQWYIGLFDAEKNETKQPIDSVDDIYRYSDAIQAMAKHWAT